MPHTEFSSVLAQAIQAKLTTNKQSLGLADILFGNQQQIPRSPTVVVNPGLKRRELRGVAAPGGRTFNTMIVYVDVHLSKVGDEATERLASHQLAEAIEKVLHADTTMGGIIIHGFVTDSSPGDSFFQLGGEFRTVRLTYVGTSETYLSA